jgi:Domain of unknown function (DUF5668)
MARDWEAYEARIREQIDERMAKAAERARQSEQRAQRHAERMKQRFERHARRAAERAEGRSHSSWPVISIPGFGGKNCASGGEPGAWVGLIILGVGVALLLESSGWVAFRDLVRFWPLILIVAGGMRIGRAKFPSARAFGFFLLISGVIFLLGNLGVVRLNWNLFWPAILILMGIKHLMRNFDPPAPATAAASAQQPGAPPPPPQPPPPANPLGDWNTSSRGGPETPTSGPRATNDVPPPPRPEYVGASAPGPHTTTTLGPDVYLHEYCIFTGGRRRIVSDNFRGGELVAAFGGIDVDLRNCIMGGYEATIDVNAAFGGCTIRVPLNWYVDMRVVAAFGGSSNKTIPPRGGPGQRIPKLTITGSAAFGGVVVEN